MLDVRVKGSSCKGNDELLAIVDTGTSLLVGSPVIVDKLLLAVGTTG